jgi:thiol-disulfide isomerase/thioredoxin
VPGLGDDPPPREIKCRKCGTVYPPPGEDDEPAPARAPRRKSQAGSLALILVVIGGSLALLGLLVVTAVILGAVFWFHRDNPVAKAPDLAPVLVEVGKVPLAKAPNPPPVVAPAGGPGGVGTQVGMSASEIDGEDINGNHIKLSDFRGKVVLLDFWGHWCPHCRAMYSHERSLVTKLADKPFLLLGVNSDKDRAALKGTVTAEKISWRSFWNGGGSNGPISQAWGVQAWPTLVLIDHKGVIRQRWVGAPPAAVLDRAIDDLVKEAGGG